MPRMARRLEKTIVFPRLTLPTFRSLQPAQLHDSGELGGKPITLMDRQMSGQCKKQLGKKNERQVRISHDDRPQETRESWM